MDKRFQVFVSSTYSDLKQERSAIIQALMQMDCIPAGMELFPAADEEQFEFIKKIIDDCDYYILIIAGRYGSSAADGISYTEKEYDYAREKGLQVLSFVHSSPDDLGPAKCDRDPEIVARLDMFREKVKLGRLVKLWSDPRELPGLVAISLSKAMKTHPAIGWVRANQVSNTELLNEINELRKRNEELGSRLRELTPALENLAGLSDALEMQGMYRRGNEVEARKVKTTWAEIFSAIGPQIFECPNDAKMHLVFNERMQGLFNTKSTSIFPSAWEPFEAEYENVKLQLIALNLVNIELRQTTTGQMALFWFLTPLGRETLLRLRTKKATKATSA